MSKNVDELSSNQWAVIGYLLMGKTQNDAAELVGVTPDTISRWKRDNAQFVTTLNEQKRQLAHTHITAIQRLQLAAVAELHALIIDSSTRTPTKLQAVKIALSARIPELVPIDPAEYELNRERVKLSLEKRKRLELGEELI